MKKLFAVVMALFVALGMLFAPSASADHLSTTTISGQTLSGISGTFSVTYTWDTNSAHNGVRPYSAKICNNTNRGLTHDYTYYTFYPGGVLLASNETELGYDQRNMGINMGTCNTIYYDEGWVYANVGSYPTWEVNVMQTSATYNDKSVFDRW